MIDHLRIGATISLLFALVFLAPQPAHAQDPIGTIKTLGGETKIVRLGRPETAKIGQPIHQDDVILTGKDGSLGVTFTDSSMFSVGPNTEIVVDKYVFDPDNSDASFTANMAKGTLQFISGEIAKLSPDAVKVNIPTGTIAVRGTRFLVEVSRPGL